MIVMEHLPENLLGLLVLFRFDVDLSKADVCGNVRFFEYYCLLVVFLCGFELFKSTVG